MLEGTTEKDLIGTVDTLMGNKFYGIVPFRLFSSRILRDSGFSAFSAPSLSTSALTMTR